MNESPSSDNPVPLEPQLIPDNLPSDLEKVRYQAWIEIAKAKQIADIEVEKAKKLASIEANKAEIQFDFERVKLDYSHDYTLSQKLYESYLEIAKGQIAQASYRAEFVQKASAAIGSSYTAILAFRFTKELPARGIAPTLFAGLSLVLATAYISFVTEPEKVQGYKSSGGMEGKHRASRDTFIAWTQQAAGISRIRLLRSSIWSLGACLAFLPSAFIKIDDGLVLVASLVFIFIISLNIFKEKRSMS